MPFKGRTRRCWLREVCRVFWFRRKPIVNMQNGEKIEEEIAATKKIKEQNQLSSLSHKHSCKSTVETRPNPTIMDLPVELHLMIFALMSLPSQVSFALSCKCFYRMFGSALDDDRLVFPRLYSSKRFEMPLKRADILRNRVLVQLEDSRWAYCSVCLKLHPRDEFNCWMVKQPPCDRRCMYRNGIAHLCPCLSLTPRDQLHLGDWLKAGTLDNGKVSAQFRMLFNAEGERYLVHECCVTDNVDAFIRINFKFQLDAHQGLLIVQSMHHFHINWQVPTSEYLASRGPCREPVWLCPQVNLMDIVSDPWTFFTKCFYCSLHTTTPLYSHDSTVVHIGGTRILSLVSPSPICGPSVCFEVSSRFRRRYEGLA